MYRLTLFTSLLFSLSLKTVCCRADKELKALRQDLAERVETLSKDVGDAEQVFQVLTSCPYVIWVPALVITLLCKLIRYAALQCIILLKVFTYAQVFLTQLSKDDARYAAKLLPITSLCRINRYDLRRMYQQCPPNFQILKSA